MGQVQSSTGGPPIYALPKCPAPFESAGNMSCIMTCPTEKGFERRAVNGGFKCVYKADPRQTATLKTLSAVLFSGSSLADLQKSSAKEFSEFSAEKDRFSNEIAVLYANIDKDSKLKDAFNGLQAAENARDTAPQAYQQARTMYYTLLKGDSWKEEEKTRISKAEVEPEIRQYMSQKEDALKRFNAQRQTMDVVKGVKDRVLSLRDEFKYSVDTFSDQLGKLKNQINTERRGRVQETPATSIWTWFDTILNLAIVGSLLYAIMAIYPKFTAPATPVYTLPRQ